MSCGPVHLVSLAAKQAGVGYQEDFHSSGAYMFRRKAWGIYVFSHHQPVDWLLNIGNTGIYFKPKNEQP